MQGICSPSPLPKFTLLPITSAQQQFSFLAHRKAKYCKNVARKIILSVEKKKTLPKILLLQGMQMLVSAWDALSTQMIANCFRKSGISTENQEKAEDDDPFHELQDKIDDLRFVQPNLIEKDFDATTFVDVDAEVIDVQAPPSDTEIVAELLEMEGISDDNDYYSSEVADEPVNCPDKNELLQVIEALQRFSLFLDKADTIQSYASPIESQIDQHFAKKKQASIRDFLSKKKNLNCEKEVSFVFRKNPNFSPISLNLKIC